MFGGQAASLGGNCPLPRPRTATDYITGGRGTVMDYPCAKFGNFSFSRIRFIVWTVVTIVHRITDADDRYLMRLPST